MSDQIPDVAEVVREIEHWLEWPINEEDGLVLPHPLPDLLRSCLAALKGQTDLRERLETALRRARVYVEGARSYGAADLSMIDAALGLSRECSQCGWKPSAQWTSERCGSLPFGSCDGTVAPPASTPEAR